MASPHDYAHRLPLEFVRPTLTFYGSRGAPNPRRVEIFMAEHELLEGRDYTYVNVNMRRLEHKKGGKYASPNSKVPMLVIENDSHMEKGRTDILAETVAISRYIEERCCANSNTRLFGVSPLQRAVIEMWNRRIEFELLAGGVGRAWLHGPVLAPLRAATGVVGHASELELGKRVAHKFYQEVNDVLAIVDYGDFVAGGNAFTVADITLLCVLEFGAGLVDVCPAWDTLPALKAWHQRVSSRRSVRCHGNPHIKGEMCYDNVSKSQAKL
eukprot:m.44275 g.44275  ORF g.44275 m.44275 type:complete len:269 (-) comp19639_c0_seq1:24-830(-)